MLLAIPVGKPSVPLSRGDPGPQGRPVFVVLELWVRMESGGHLGHHGEKPVLGGLRVPWGCAEAGAPARPGQAFPDQ